MEIQARTALDASFEAGVPGSAEALIEAAAELSWMGGWGLVLLGMLSGVVLGLFFQREDFLGGYGSWPRRLLRLGHVALVALGALNVLAARATWSGPEVASLGALALLLGGVSMPLVCFLAAFRPGFARLFFVPVACLLAGVLSVLAGGSP